MMMAQDGKKPTKPAPKKPDQAVTLELPLGPGPTPQQYAGPRHVEVGYLSEAQRLALHRLLGGLHGRQLSTGRLVQSGADVIRYLLDRVAEVPA